MTAIGLDLLDVLVCPACGGPMLARASDLCCATCRRSFPVANGIPELCCERDASAEALRAFYAAAPFPGYPPRDSYAALRARAERSEFARLLDRAIAPDATVLEVGCGTGQMSLFLASGSRLVVGADLSRASLSLAACAARRFGIERVRFVETDLRHAALRPGAFDVVYCSGVLHHTPDPGASFRAIARLARPGGIIVAGVYNAYARIPHRLRRALARLSGWRWFPFDPVLRDRAAEPDRREAWLRDQYRHLEEHRHTLAEVQSWFAACDVEYLRTYPRSEFAERALEERDLFAPARDNWGFENVLQQLSWCWTLGREGGLFVVIGQRGQRHGGAGARAGHEGAA
jgi:SAM-dependent methyltransferase